MALYQALHLRCCYFPLFYILELNASVHGLDTNFSFYTLVIVNASSFLGRIVPGFLSRKSPRFDVGYMITFSTLCCSVLIFAIIGVKVIARFVIVGFLYGFFVGDSKFSY
jgi:predicted MFS family arabinose efflux permease